MAVERPNKIYQASGGVLLLILAGICWVYGFESEIRYAKTTGYPTTGLTEAQQAQSIEGVLLVLSTIFTIIGFGLLLTYFNKSTFLAISTSLFTVSFTVILSPILSKFWFNIFLGNFTGGSSTPVTPTRMIYYSFGGTPIYLDFYNLKVALANSIAQLVAMLALYGRLNPAQLFFNSLGFNLTWNLNHFICCFLVTYSPDARIFDDYQISNVYLFSAAYGLVSSSLIKSPLTAISEFRTSRNS